MFTHTKMLRFHTYINSCFNLQQIHMTWLLSEEIQIFRPMRPFDLNLLGCNVVRIIRSSRAAYMNSGVFSDAKVCDRAAPSNSRMAMTHDAFVFPVGSERI